MRMKNSYLAVLKLLKGKKHPLDAKKGGCHRRYFHSSSSIVERKKKVSTHISYSLPAQRENEKYSFEVLMKTMKNRADEYNLIKIKEAQNKILIHLNTFTINQVVSTLVLSHKYNMLNFKILHAIIEHLFRHSCFLNSKHLYVLVSIVRKIHLDNVVYPSQRDNHESRDNHNAHLEDYLEDCDNTSTYDLYIRLHFHLLKNMLTECEFIDNKFVMEKIENGTSINEDVYRDAKLYLEVFSLFFQNMERVTERINHLKVFHLNILSHELFKHLCNDGACKNVNIYYAFLRRVSCESILKGEANPDVCYCLLSVLYYLKRGNMLNCEIRPFGYPPFGEPTFDLQKIQDRYSLFLNSLNQYTLHDLLIPPHEAKEAINTNCDTPIKRTPNGEPPTIEQSPHNLRDNFLVHFMAEFTFNVVCYLNRIDTYEQLFILKHLILLNLKNEYLIDVLKERQRNFFIQKKHYTDRKHFFYFVEYLFTSFIYSTHEFLNLIHLIDLRKFQIVLDAIGRTKKFTHKVKKIFDAVNVILNQRKHNCVKIDTKKKVRNNQFENKSTALPEDTTQVQRFQNILYDFLFL
ncbi:hypothetical protein PCYB_135350 [Plasmodium cynomolgi strain B]|uniref:Uncharacterized protein n=1 Tax=Plasmodium cynomolgi (strain B) TaxID=1120755 RepID=K6UEN5_PLACD|nr:hypothetical protein PCYB_135350 [Plasmodium cynomolgi strain B]GAB68661.1 hypothetical protein PCYB_135350 [Plasmodium cynomolgi strain B]